jgi:hypothetical protein
VSAIQNQKFRQQKDSIIPDTTCKKINHIKARWPSLLTRFASSLSGRHSPNAFTSDVIFFSGYGRATARIIGFLGFVKKRIICHQLYMQGLSVLKLINIGLTGTSRQSSLNKTSYKLASEFLYVEI